jgi:hypothetical protein
MAARDFQAVMAILVVAACLFAASTPTAAQTVGSDLVEPLEASVSGDEAYATLASVEVFAPEGGEAVIEPGTDQAETFGYAGVDVDTNRLVGLVRPSPSTHEVGAFVAPAEPDGPTPVPSPEASSSPEPAGETAATHSGGDDTVSTLDPVCGAVADQTCSESCPEVHSGACEAAAEIVGEVDSEHPCDPAHSGQTCGDYVASILEEVEEFIISALGDPCDPDDTGQTCEEFVTNTLQPDVCDFAWPTLPVSQDVLLGVKQVFGDVAVTCFAGPIDLEVCLEYGSSPGTAVPMQPCQLFPMEGHRTDGYAVVLPCFQTEGFQWFTHATVFYGGAPLDSAHSPGSTVDCKLET